jgi:hypothetical protein
VCGIEQRCRGDSYILHVASDSPIELLGQEDKEMHRAYQYLFSSLVLTAALAAPSAMNAATRPQDNGRQEENHRDDRDSNRVYDRYHKDYHNWNDHEDHAYRGYLQERHRDYRPLAEQRQKDQKSYWNWRHSHPDHDNGR